MQIYNITYYIFGLQKEYAIFYVTSSNLGVRALRCFIRTHLPVDQIKWTIAMFKSYNT